MAVGDEYVVRMPGPWDGPVRVIASDELSFRLATLEGHLEAGQIEFRALAAEPMVFEIDAARMHADGHTFFVSANGVWLTDAVPAQYLKLS